MLNKYNFGRYGWHAILHPLFGSKPLGNAILNYIQLNEGMCFALLPSGLDTNDMNILVQYRFVMFPLTGGSDALACSIADDVVLDLSDIILRIATSTSGPSTLIIEDPSDCRESVMREAKAVNNETFSSSELGEMGFLNYQARLCGDIVYRKLSLDDCNKLDLAKFVRSTTYWDVNPSIVTNLAIAGDNYDELQESHFNEIARNCYLMFASAFDFSSYFIWVKNDRFLASAGIEVDEIINFE